MKIFSDIDLLQRHPELPPAQILYPFVGIYPEPFQDTRAPMSKRFDEYCAHGRKIISLCGLEDAEFFVFPFEWYGLSDKKSFAEDILGAFSNLASRHGRSCLVFAYGDQYVDLSNHENIVVFQSNLNIIHLKQNEHAMPAFIENIFYGSLKKSGRSRYFLKWPGLKRRPVLSFCGYAGSAPQREEALKVYNATRAVKTQFIFRESYYGGSWDKRIQSFDFKKLNKVRRQYIANLMSGDYVLCVRGWGNYSVRFYEALCCGRIPVLIDTDTVLPFAAEIDYDKFIVRIPFEQVDSADRLLAEFDANLTDEEFAWRQARCRQVWLEYLSPLGFFKNLTRLLSSDHAPS